MTIDSKLKKRGRPPKKPSRTWEVGKGENFTLRILKEDFPNMDLVLSAKNPKELREKFGIILPENLNWPKEYSKSLSYRTGAILEAIAQQALQENKDDEKKENFNT